CRPTDWSPETNVGGRREGDIPLHVSGGSVSPWPGTFASAIWGAWGKRVPLPARNLWPQCGCAAKPCPQDAFHVCLPQSLLRGVNDLSEHRAQRADHCTATTSRVADGLASLSARVEKVFVFTTLRYPRSISCFRSSASSATTLSAWPSWSVPWPRSKSDPGRRLSRISVVPRVMFFGFESTQPMPRWATYPSMRESICCAAAETFSSPPRAAPCAHSHSTRGDFPRRYVAS